MNFNEEIFSKYNFFTEKNKKIISEVLDDNNMYYNDFNDCFFILENIYNQITLNGKLYDEEDISIFEYCFDYITGIVDVLDHLGVNFIFNKQNTIAMYELINLYNYNFAILNSDFKELADQSNTILVNYIGLLKAGEVNNQILNNVELFITSNLTPKIEEHELPNEVFESLTLKLIKRKISE